MTWYDRDYYHNQGKELEFWTLSTNNWLDNPFMKIERVIHLFFCPVSFNGFQCIDHCDMDLKF